LTGQISSYFAANRRRKFGSVGKVSLGALQVSLAQYRDIPSEIDEGYVLDAQFDVSTNDEGSFTIVWSTVRQEAN
jgi:hypothetical protein